MLSYKSKKEEKETNQLTMLFIILFKGCGGKLPVYKDGLFARLERYFFKFADVVVTPSRFRFTDQI